MKKLIVSISITLVIFSTLYFLIEENYIQLKSARFKDLIGKNIESEYVELTNILSLGFQRYIAITNKKLDRLLESADLRSLGKRGIDKQAVSILKDFKDTDPYCQRIRIINRNLEIVFSTADADLLRTELNQELYGEIFTEPSSSLKAPLIDPLAESIIFYKNIDVDENRRFAVLFYYIQDSLDSIFHQVETLDYKSFLITTDKIILINFPEIDLSEEQNLSGLIQLISENDSGVVRILLGDYDKTIYYQNLPDTSLGWKVGLTLDTERLRISKIGTLILITQAIVVLSVLIFVFISLRRKMEMGQQKIAAAAAAPGSGLPGAAAGAAVESGTEIPAAGDEIETFGTGVVSLKDVEEVTEVEDLGEAEVAEEVVDEDEDTVIPEPKSEISKKPSAAENENVQEEEVEALEELEEAVEEVEELEEAVEEVEELEEAGEEVEELEVAEEDLTESDIEEVGVVEPVEDDVGELLDREQSGIILPELMKLVEAGSGTQTKRKEDKATLVQRHREDSGEKETITEETDGESVIIDEEEKPLTVPEAVYREKESVQHDDELSYLIDRIDEKVGQLLDISRIGSIYNEFITHLGITTGAILFRNQEGTYTPFVSSGLSRRTENNLNFKKGDKILTNLLRRGKTLHIKENPFLNQELKNKFESVDASKVKELFLSPMFKSKKLVSIVTICVTMGEMFDSELILKEIKKLTKIITKIV